MTIPERTAAERAEEWTAFAVRAEAADRAEWLHELELRDASESIEAAESHWAGVFAANPDRGREVVYDEPAWLERRMRGPHG